MAGRTLPLHKPVRISLDGEPIEAEQGEPLAASLLAAGKPSFARSPKFHRPRGPACMRAACDGCLARVDDVPNVMTCMAPAREGSRVVVQNTLGSRETDLLRVTDWFFPEGMDHHHLFAGIPGVQSVMQVFARRVAGLGQLPTREAAARSARRARRRSLDVVVVGAGPAGMAVASRLVRGGRSVEIMEEALAWGGLRALAAADAAPWRGIEQSCEEAIANGLRVRLRTAVCGVYGDDVLVVGPDGAEILSARAIVLATGAHDGVLAFEGNDVPGVMSARAGGVLARLGVVVGENVVVVVSKGGGPFGESYARMAQAQEGVTVTVARGEPVRVTGSSRVRGVTVQVDGAERKLKADVLLVDAPRSPSFELAEQVGATLAHEARGFVVRAPGGKIREGVWVVGEAAGGGFDPRSTVASADEVANQILGAP